MSKDQFFTKRWNNIISLVGGLLLLLYIAFVMTNTVLSDKWAFYGLVLIGVVY